MVDKILILKNVKIWFSETISVNHIRNTLKLKDIREFNVNPFLAIYLSNFLTGNSNPESIAKALIYPRVLGTSITTSFGQNMQGFTSKVLGAFGSTTAGMDIEFIDQIDHQRKYCQLKAGPNTINKDDVETIANHFKGVRSLAQTNNLRIPRDDMIVGVIYGEASDLSGHYKRITADYDFPVIIGKNFWHRLTGDPEFYQDLIEAIGEVAREANFAKELEEVVEELALDPEIQKLAGK
ncbi:PmeII family type II restriction endonuclease [Thiothrix eikelboomii]|uniref:PmeII family type II restriction endonuclease n=1 Tax=Thiothrix eikelboomii TaxID=92487 RepID=UPI003BAF79FE